MDACVAAITAESTTTTMEGAVSPQSHAVVRLTKEGIAGGPVTCVSLLLSERLCLYAQGPFLHRVPIDVSNSDDTDKDDSLLEQQRKDRLLVFPQGGTIHGIRRLPDDATETTTVTKGRSVAGETLVLTFGGRTIGFCKGAADESTGMEVVPIHTSHRQQCFMVSDWIWNCRFSRGCQANDCKLVVGLSHNTIEIWHISMDSRQGMSVHLSPLQTVQGKTRCISYCLDMYTTLSDVTIALGTVTNEILVWTLPYTYQPKSSATAMELQRPQLHEHCLTAHKGVIHAVRFHKSRQMLASTSDDRSVRVWSLHDGKWAMKWTAWGHTARGWDVAFASSPDNGACVVSTGEDGTVRVWSEETGKSMAAFRGHACQCIWSVDAVQNRCLSLMATGGNDGTVAFYDLNSKLFGKIPCTKPADVDQCLQTALPQSWIKDIDIPDDRPKQDLSVEAKDMIPKMKKRGRHDRQIIVGMKFVDASNEFAKGKSLLVVATRLGSMMYMDTQSLEWTQLEPWWKDLDSDTKRQDVVSGSEGCCMCIHPTIPFIAIGTTRGVIVFVRMRKLCLGSNEDACETDCHSHMDALRHRSAQKLAWLSDKLMVSFHVQTVLIWNVLGELDDAAGGHTLNLSLALSTGLKGVPISCSLDETVSNIVVGDSRGNMSLFPNLNIWGKSGCSLTPISVIRRAHGNEHVTSILWKDTRNILSAGNDGCLVETEVLSDGHLRKRLSVPISPFTGLTFIWKGQKSDQIIVGGYDANIFSVMDVASGYEYLRIDTQGRQRSLEILSESQAFPVFSTVAVCHNQQEGSNGIHMVCSGLGRQNVESACHNVPRVLKDQAGVSLHGESVFDCCAFLLNRETLSFAIVTGSEDCTSKISLYQNGVLRNSKLLPPQISGIRAVSSCPCPSGSSLLVVGGKETIQFYIVGETHKPNASEVSVRYLGNGRPSSKAEIDHRINATRALRLSSVKIDFVLVVTADSNGCCYMYRLSLAMDPTTVVGECFYSDDRPILSVELVDMDAQCAILIGTTDGTVLLFAVLTSTLETYTFEHLARPLLSFKAHSMGTNSISARYIETDSGDMVLRVMSCGDDQAICRTDIKMNETLSGGLSGPVIIHSNSIQNAGISALKGVEYVDHYRVVTTGYDQRLSVWHCDKKSLIRTVDCAIDVGDVNCLASCERGNGEHLLVVCGGGVECLKMSVQNVYS